MAAHMVITDTKEAGTFTLWHISYNAISFLATSPTVAVWGMSGLLWEGTHGGGHGYLSSTWVCSLPGADHGVDAVLLCCGCTAKTGSSLSTLWYVVWFMGLLWDVWRKVPKPSLLQLLLILVTSYALSCQDFIPLLSISINLWISAVSFNVHSSTFLSVPILLKLQFMYLFLSDFSTNGKPCRLLHNQYECKRCVSVFWIKLLL